jgi:phage shock protein A
MAQTLLAKVQLLVSATLHSLVDQVFQSNSLTVFDQYIRDAEQSMETLKSALVDLLATTKALKSKYEKASNAAAKIDLQVDKALQQNQSVAAKIEQSKLNHQLEIAKTYQEQFQKQDDTYQTLLEAVQVLEAKVEVLHSQREQVATLLALVKSKNTIARSMKDVQTIADDKAAQIAEDVRSQLDTVDARLEVATGRLSTQIERELGDTALNTQLEIRRQRLGLS